MNQCYITFPSLTCLFCVFPQASLSDLSGYENFILSCVCFKKVELFYYNLDHHLARFIVWGWSGVRPEILNFQNQASPKCQYCYQGTKLWITSLPRTMTTFSTTQTLSSGRIRKWMRHIRENSCLKQHLSWSGCFLFWLMWGWGFLQHHETAAACTT